MNREIYLDNAATTRAFDEVGERVRDCMCKTYGNPSSLHMKGLEAEHILRDSAQIIAGILGVGRENIFFTSGGTESDNLAVLGAAAARSRAGHHIISSRLEHPAVQAPLQKLAEEGYEVTYAEPDTCGVLDPERIAAQVRPDTILISVMAVNNEIGSVQPVREIAAACKEKNPNVLVHSDAVQGFGKMALKPRADKVDLLTFSSHKIHGPKGVGGLYAADTRILRPVLFGGGQQKDIRPGTENVPGIAGFALAAQMMNRMMKENEEHERRLKRMLAEGILNIPDTRIHGMSAGMRGLDHGQAAAGYAAWGAASIVSAAFADVSAEVLLHALEDKGIYVSSGSACSSNHPKVSEVLKAIRADREDMESTLRFSMSGMTSESDIEETIAALNELVPVLRRFTRK